MKLFAVDSAGLLKRRTANFEALSPMFCIVKLDRIMDKIALLNTIATANNVTIE